MALYKQATMAMRGGLAASVVAGLVSTSPVAEAAAPIELSWIAPQECPGEPALVHAVEGFLGADLARAAEASLTITARVQATVEHGYVAKLAFAAAGGTSQRELEHPDCGKLLEGAALLIALAIDPESVRARQDSSAAVELGPSAPVVASAPVGSPVPLEQTPAVVPVALDRPPDQPKRTQPLRASASLLGIIGAGMLPGTVPGIGADFSLRYGYFEAAVTGRFWAPRSAPLPGTDSASVELSLATGGLRACGVVSHARWAVPLCARAELGMMSGHGRDVNNARARQDLFGAWGGSASVAYSLGRLSPVAGADLLWAQPRPRFGALRDGQGVQAFRPQAWQISAFLGLAYVL